MQNRRSPIPTLLVLAAAVLIVAAGASLLVVRHGGSSPSARATSATRSPNAGIVIVRTGLGYEDGSAAGTGMVLTSSGEVLTNNHVIAGATSVDVDVPGGRRYTARVVGYDVSDDVAVLQLEGASGLATVSSGDSSSLAVGQAVRAVGNAGGTGSLQTAPGTITGLGKSITASTDNGSGEQLTGLVETNAALQPGDSGGPLLDASGRVIGMDTAASTGGGDGLSSYASAAGDAYAIPIDEALSIAQQIENGDSSGTVHVGGTAFLGVQVESGGQDDGSGAMVAGVVSGSPAEQAGLGQGETITAIDGQAVATPDAIVSALEGRKPGDRITVEWTDGYGNASSATITLASGPPQ